MFNEGVYMIIELKQYLAKNNLSGKCAEFMPMINWFEKIGNPLYFERPDRKGSTAALIYSDLNVNGRPLICSSSFGVKELEIIDFLSFIYEDLNNNKNHLKAQVIVKPEFI